MPQIIEIPDIGQVEFPDGMSDADIALAIQNNISPPKPLTPLGMGAARQQAELEAAANDPSMAGSFLRGARENLGAGVGGALAGAASGAATGAGLGAMGLNPITVGIGTIGGSIIGGIGGAFGGQKIQEVIDPITEERQAAIARDMEVNPISSFSGQIAPALITGKFSPGNIRTALTPLGRASNAVERAAIINSRINVGSEVGIGGALDVGQALASGQPMDARQIALNAAAGAFFSDPNRLGRALGQGAMIPSPIEAAAPPVQAAAPIPLRGPLTPIAPTTPPVATGRTRLAGDMAARFGIDPMALRPSGAGATVTPNDVRAAAANLPAITSDSGGTIDITPARKPDPTITDLIDSNIEWEGQAGRLVDDEGRPAMLRPDGALVELPFNYATDRSLADLGVQPTFDRQQDRATATRFFGETENESLQSVFSVIDNNTDDLLDIAELGVSLKKQKGKKSIPVHDTPEFAPQLRSITDEKILVAEDQIKQAIDRAQNNPSLSDETRTAVINKLSGDLENISAITAARDAGKYQRLPLPVSSPEVPSQRASLAASDAIANARAASRILSNEPILPAEASAAPVSRKLTLGPEETGIAPVALENAITPLTREPDVPNPQRPAAVETPEAPQVPMRSVPVGETAPTVPEPDGGIPKAPEAPEAKAEDAVGRDATKPEQMTAAERKSNPTAPDTANHGVYKTKNEADERLASMFENISSNPSMRKIIDPLGISPSDVYRVAKTPQGKWGIAKTHQHEIGFGVVNRKPVSVEAVDTYGIKLPDGYVKQGDLYVHQPSTESITLDAEAPAPAPRQLSATTRAKRLAVEIKDIGNQIMAQRQKITDLKKNSASKQTITKAEKQLAKLQDTQSQKKQERADVKFEMPPVYKELSKGASKIRSAVWDNIENFPGLNSIGNDRIKSPPPLLALILGKQRKKITLSSKEINFLAENKKGGEYDGFIKISDIDAMPGTPEGREAAKDILRSIYAKHDDYSASGPDTISPDKDAGTLWSELRSEIEDIAQGKSRAYEDEYDAYMAKLEAEAIAKEEALAKESAPNRPVSQMDIRNQDSRQLFDDDGGFALASENTQDGAEIVAERNAKEEAAKAQDKAQGKLFEETSDPEAYDFDPMDNDPFSKTDAPARTADTVGVEKAADDFFGGKRPENVKVVNEPKANWEARIKGNTIELNAAKVGPEGVRSALHEEVGHAAFRDEKERAVFQRLYDSLDENTRTKINDTVDKLYSDASPSLKAEEKLVKALRSILDRTPEGRTFWQKLVQIARRTYKSLTGQAAKDPEMIAASLLRRGMNAVKKGSAGEGIFSDDVRYMIQKTSEAPDQNKLDSMKSGLPKYTAKTRISPYQKTIEIFNADGDLVGIAYMSYGQPKNNKSVLNVDNTEVFDGYRKQGYGEALYREIAKFAQEKEIDIISSSSISDDAQRVREKLFSTTYKDAGEGVAGESSIDPDIRYSNVGNTTPADAYRKALDTAKQEVADRADYKAQAKNVKAEIAKLPKAEQKPATIRMYAELDEARIIGKGKDRQFKVEMPKVAQEIIASGKTPNEQDILNALVAKFPEQKNYLKKNFERLVTDMLFAEEVAMAGENTPWGNYADSLKEHFTEISEGVKDGSTLRHIQRGLSLFRNTYFNGIGGKMQALADGKLTGKNSAAANKFFTDIIGVRASQDGVNFEGVDGMSERDVRQMTNERIKFDTDLEAYFKKEGMGDAARAAWLERVSDHVVNPSRDAELAQEPKLKEAVDYFIKRRRERLTYLREAGVDVGDAGERSLSRSINTEKVLSNPKEFVEKAKRAYMRKWARDISDLREQQALKEAEGKNTASIKDKIRDLEKMDAQVAAEKYLYAITSDDTGISSDGNDITAAEGGGQPSFLKKREFGPEADELLGKFYHRNIAAMDTAETLATVRAATKARVLADKSYGNKIDPVGKWKKLRAELEAEGNQDMIPIAAQLVKDYLNLNGSNNDTVRKLVGHLHTYTQLAYLSHATVASLGEPAMIGARTGSIIDTGRAYAQIAKGIVRALRKAGPDEIRILNRELGLVADSFDGLMSSQALGDSFGGRGKGGGLVTNFHRLTGLSGWTNLTFDAATKIGKSFIASQVKLAKAGGSMSTLAKRELNELGMSTKDIDVVNDFITKLDKASDQNKLILGDEPGADLYRKALAMFHKTGAALNPTRGTRGQKANNPVAGLFYQLQSFLYDFHQKFTLRQARRLKDAYRGTVEIDGATEKLSARERSQVAIDAAKAIAAIYGLQYGIQVLRETLFVDLERNKRDKEKTQGEINMARALGAASRTGVLGPYDTLFNIISGARYQREPATVVLGPAVGGMSELFQSVVNLYGDRNSGNTNTTERKLARTAYNTLATPAMNAVFAGMPAGPLSAGLVQAFRHPLTREAVVSGVAGPIQTKKKGPMKTTKYY